MTILISSIILCISYIMFKKAAGTLSILKINLISFIFYFNIVIQSFIGSVMIMIKVDNDPVINYFEKSSDLNIRLLGWIIVLYTMISMPAGMLLVKNILKIRSVDKLLKKYEKMPIVCLISKKDSFIRIPLYIMTILSIFTVIYTYYNIKNIPWLGVISGKDAMMLAFYREEVGTDFGGNSFIRQILGNMMTPILTFISYSYWKMTNSKKDHIWFVILFISTFFILTQSLAKAPIIFFIFGFLFVNNYIKGKVEIQNIIKISILSIIILLLFYIYVMKFTDIYQMFFKPGSGLIWRIIITQIVGLYGTLTIFPKYHNNLSLFGVSSILSKIFGESKTDSSARIVMKFINPDGVELGTAGVANSLFQAEAWAHYGYFGIIVAPIITGIIIEIIYLFLLKKKKTPLFIGILTYLSYKTGITTSFWYYIFNPDLIKLFAIMFIVYYSSVILYQTRGIKIE